MIQLTLAVLGFVGGHFLLSSPPVREPVVARVGEPAFSGIYSALMLTAFVWMVRAFRAASFIALWNVPPDARVIPAIVMPLACLLLVGSLTVRNPTMIRQSIAATGDPAPGLLKVTRYPMLWAFGLWAVAHLIVNGEMAAQLLFGGIAILAFGGTLGIDAKRARPGRVRPAGCANLQHAAGSLDRRSHPAALRRYRLVAAAACRCALRGTHFRASTLQRPHADLSRR
jgi:uncharacterized membrane protein